MRGADLWDMLGVCVRMDGEVVGRACNTKGCLAGLAFTFAICPRG